MTSLGASWLTPTVVATALEAMRCDTASLTVRGRFCASSAAWGCLLASLLRRTPRVGLDGSVGFTARAGHTPLFVTFAPLEPPRAGVHDLHSCTQERLDAVASVALLMLAATSLAYSTSQADGVAWHAVPAASRWMRLPLWQTRWALRCSSLQWRI